MKHRKMAAIAIGHRRTCPSLDILRLDYDNIIFQVGRTQRAFVVVQDVLGTNEVNVCCSGTDSFKHNADAILVGDFPLRRVRQQIGERVTLRKQYIPDLMPVQDFE